MTQTRPQTRSGESGGKVGRLRRGPRRLLLVVHILASVTLWGNAAAIATLTVAGGGGRATYRVLPLLAHGLGVPLLLTALASGVLLAVLTQWGLFRHGWVVVKLGLLVAVWGCGALVLGPAIQWLIDEPQAEAARWTVVAGEGFQMAALMAALVLSVFKPKGILPRLR